MSNRKYKPQPSAIKTVKGVKVVKAADRNHSAGNTDNDSVPTKPKSQATQERELAEKWGINDKTSMKMADSNISELARVFFN